MRLPIIPLDQGIFHYIESYDQNKTKAELLWSLFCALVLMGIVIVACRFFEAIGTFDRK